MKAGLYQSQFTQICAISNAGECYLNLNLIKNQKMDRNEVEFDQLYKAELEGIRQAQWQSLAKKREGEMLFLHQLTRHIEQGERIKLASIRNEIKRQTDFLQGKKKELEISKDVIKERKPKNDFLEVRKEGLEGSREVIQSIKMKGEVISKRDKDNVNNDNNGKMMTEKDTNNNGDNTCHDNNRMNHDTKELIERNNDRDNLVPCTITKKSTISHPKFEDACPKQDGKQKTREGSLGCLDERSSKLQRKQSKQEEKMASKGGSSRRQQKWKRRLLSLFCIVLGDDDDDDL